MNTHRAFSVRRRQMLLAGLAGMGALAAAGSYRLLRSDSGPAEWVVAVIRRNLPGVQLDEDSLAEFARTMSLRDGPVLGSIRRRGGVMLAHALPTLASTVPELKTALAELERLVVSEYLLGSNFFRLTDVMRETIIYAGSSPACGNPFAIFNT